MSILIHRTAITKVTGQKSDPPDSIPSDLFHNDINAHFDPKNISSSIWSNGHTNPTSKNLRLFNHAGSYSNNGNFYWLAFDGSDDYIWGCSTGYGGDPYLLRASTSFAIGHWVRGTPSSTPFTMCGQTTSSADFFYSWIGTDGTWNLSNGHTQVTSRGVISANTWHYLSIDWDRDSQTISMYINGSFHNSGDWSSNFTNNDMEFGFGHHRVGNPTNINSDSTLRLGKIIGWNAGIGASVHREAFLTSHCMNADDNYDGSSGQNRYYGATYTRS